MKNIFVKLSLVLMLITMSVGQVWGGTGIYLRGINGSWDAQASLEFEATGTSNLYTKTLTLASYSEFKIADANWSDGCNYGAGTTPVIGTSLNLTSKGNNISVTNLTGGQTYVFTLDLRSSTKTLLISKPTYDVVVNAGSHGSVKVGSTTVSSGNNQTFKVGADQIAIVATPASGYSFAGWEKTGDVTINTPTNASTHMTATGTGTVTATWSVSVPTPSMVTDGSMIIKSKVQAKAAYMWGSSTYCDNLTLYKNSSMGHQYVSAYENSKKNKNAIFFNATVTPGTGWPGDSYNSKKITGDISVSGTAPTIFFYKSDATSTSSSDGNWSAFTHIGATLALSETTVIPNTTVKLLYSGLTGTLSDAANNTWNFYYTKDGGSTKRIASADRKYPTSGSSAPTFTPSEVGTYVVYAYLTDPYGLETVLLNTCTLTVSSAQNFDASIEAQPTHGGITLDGGTSTISVAQGSTYNVVVTPDPHYYVSDITKNSTSDIENFSESNGIYSKTATMGAANEEWAADMTPTWSVRGNFNSWSAGNYIEHFDGNTGYVDIELTAGTYEFKVYHHGYTYQYGNNGKMTRNNCTGWTMENPAGKANCQIDADIDGTYRLTFDVDTKKLTVTYPCKPSGWTIDFINDNYAVEDMPMVDNGDGTFKLTFYITNDIRYFRLSDGCTTYTIDNTKDAYGNPLNGQLVESTYKMGYDGGLMNFVTATIDGNNIFTLGAATPEDIQASLSAEIENPVREAGNSAIHFQNIVAKVPDGLKGVKIAVYELNSDNVSGGTKQTFKTDLAVTDTEYTTTEQTFEAGHTYYYCLALYQDGIPRVYSQVLTITVNGQGTITYDANGATSGSVPEPQVYNEGSDVTLATNTGDLARSGYAFIGWSLTQDGSDNNYTAGQTVSGFTGDKILYARWAEVKVYVVGRFQSKHDGTVVTTYSGDGNWKLEATTIPFTYNEGVGVYELSTNLSAKTLSDKLKDINPYFMLRTRIGSEWVKFYFNNQDPVELNASKTSVSLANQSENPSSYHERLRFNDTRNEGTVKMTFNIETGVLSFEIEGATEHNITKEALTNGDLSFSRATASEGVGYTVTATPEAGYYLSAITKNGEGQTVPGRNPDGTYTINATMGDADETWAATFAAITATPHVNSDAAIVQTGATATVTLTYTPVAPKGELTFCYSLYKNNAGAWDKVDIEFTEATLPSVQFTAPMEEGTYRVGVVMHQGATCEGAAVGEEQYSSEFRIANVYTVRYGQYPSAKATLTATVSGESIGASPAEVSAGSTIVFTVSNIASKYAVQGWYADAECTRPIYDGVADNLQSYTLSNLSADAEVYVKFFAPTVVNGIDLKDETNTSTMSFAVGEKITAIPEFAYKGLGDKAYCWELLDAEDNHVAITFKSIGDKKVTLNINEAGTYKLKLTIHDADCNGDQNSTYTTGTFTVAEREYYIVGSAFWGKDNVGSLTPETTNSHGILLYFRPTLENGEYYFGPMQFSYDYRYFRIYDKGTNRFYVGSNGGDWLLRANQEMPMVVANSDKNINVVDNGNNLVLNDRNYYLYIKDGKLIAKADAPDLSPKVRLAITYTDAAGEHNLYSNEVSLPEESENSAIISFFVPQGTGFSNISYHMEQQKAGEGWVTDGIALAGDPSATESGVYYTTFTQTTDAETTITLGELTKYEGDYYVRSAAFNSMDNYLENDECKMIFTDRSNGDRFDYFACKWCNSATQDVCYCIANIYNPNLSGVLVADEYITATGKLDNKAANVRFAWKSATNYMFRAYLEGSSTEDYLKIMPDPAAAENHKIYTTAGGSTVLSNTKFTDLQDWTYTIAEVYAQLGAKVTVRAKYKDKYQYFYGEGNIETGAITGYDYLIGNADSPGEATRYKMRIVYDFKVDRLVCGWIPTEDTPIDGDKTIDCDILIIREHNEDANVIRFSDAGTDNPYNIKSVKTVYGVMQLNKSVMTDPTSYSQYAVNQMYWVSFPFDVRVGAIFGISGYGTNWRMMKYNGERRSKEGYFVETTTFWEAMTEDEVMKANTGYLLNLSFSYFANPNSTVWAHGVKSVSLYFPSSQSVEIISTQTRDIEVPAHECTIDRTFTKDGVEYNHKKTDSDWNIIGVPSFEPLKGNEKLTNENFYLWEVIDGAQTYTPQKGTDPDFNFKPTMAYMVQFGGTLNWKAGSTPVIPSPFAAPARAQENTNYTLDLRLLNSEEKMLDRTYVKLEDEASDEFELNEDMLKIDNPKYNFFARTADGYATGASSISFKDQTIELGGSVAKEQEYTIRLNRSVNCDVRLIDREEGTSTNLNIMDYTTTIPAGSLGNRFALRIQTSQEVVTGFENTATDKDDIKKFMIDGILYIQHNGTVYDAMGRRQY